MRAYGLKLAIAGAACMVVGLGSTAYGQQGVRQRPPIVTVYSSSGVDVIGTPTYITPEIRVAENAYLFAVAMDLDGNLRVLHPELPGISVKVSSHTQLRLPNFFVGFNSQTSTVQNGYYANGHYVSGFPNSQGYYDDTRGTVLALASRVPFNLDLISRNGDWDFSAIRHLIENRTPQDAMMVLANYLGAEGQPIGRDFFRFTGGSNGYYADSYYNNGYYNNGYYDYGYYDYGYGYVPVVPYIGPATPSNRRRHPSDTTVFPKYRLPAEGHFPPGRSGGVQGSNVIVTAPTRRTEPRTIDAYRNDPGGVTPPQGRMPIERPMPRSEPSAATDATPMRYPTPPRVETAPPPRAQTYSAPVAHSSSSAPPAPPRVIYAPAQSAPAPSPPPRTPDKQ